MQAGFLSAAARDVAVDALLTTGVLRLLHRFTRQSGVTLLYHSVGSDPANPYLSEPAFRSQMDMLRTEFRVVNADEFLWYTRREKLLPPRAILITFDDGYRNNRTIVHPVMESFRLPWVLFTTTQGADVPGSALWMSVVRAVCQFSPERNVDFAGRSWSLADGRIRAYKDIARWSAMQPSERIEEATHRLREAFGHCVPQDYFDNFCALVDADDIEHLAASELIELGSHTRTHPFLPRTSPWRLHDEIVGAKHRLEDLSRRPVRMFAYPSGQYGTRELAAVSRVGFDCAFAVKRQVGTSYRFEVPRVGVYSESVATLHAKCLGATSMLRTFGIHVG